MTSAAFPWNNGRPPHLPCGPGDIAENVLTPGDPDRVHLLADMMEDVTDFGRKREFAVITGTYEGRRLTICSTGIGGPSTEIALVELAMLGARKVVRIGGMSALAAQYAPGSFVAVNQAVGDTGSACTYRMAGGKAKASSRIVTGLVDAASELGITCPPAWSRRPTAIIWARTAATGLSTTVGTCVEISSATSRLWVRLASKWKARSF